VRFQVLFRGRCPSRSVSWRGLCLCRIRLGCLFHQIVFFHLAITRQLSLSRIRQVSWRFILYFTFQIGSLCRGGSCGNLYCTRVWVELIQDLLTCMMRVGWT
jgi:hypothetical protein